MTTFTEEESAVLQELVTSLCIAAVGPAVVTMRADFVHALKGVLYSLAQPGFAGANAEQFRELAEKLAPKAATRGALK